MNANPIARCLVLVCYGLTIMTTLGCSRWIEMMALPGNAPEQTARIIASDDQVPLILDRLRITRNGSPQNPSTDTEQRVLNALAEIGLFSRLATTHDAGTISSEKSIRARIVFDEAIEPHAGRAALKGMVIGASMFILTPFLPLEYDYAAHVSLELERWDGLVKRYDSQSAGTARYQLFGATPIMIDELKGHVTETCLSELAGQLVQDSTLYVASSAPLAGPGIRNVSVKSRNPKITAAPPTAIPVAVTAEQ